MKHLKLLLILAVLIPSMCFGGVVSHQVAFVESTPSGGCTDSNCPDATYMFSLDFDYSGDTAKACFTSCGASKDGTQGGTAAIGSSYGYSGNGLYCDGNNDYYSYVVSSEDGFDPDIGTIEFWIKVPSTTGFTCLVELTDGTSSNYIAVVMRDTGQIRGYYYANSTNHTTNNSTAITDDTWALVRYSWDVANTRHSIQINGGSWVQETDALGSFTSSAAEVVVGNKNVAFTTNAFNIDEVVIRSGYQDDGS